MKTFQFYSLFFGFVILFGCDREAPKYNPGSFLGEWKHYQSRTQITSKNGEVTFSDTTYALETPNILTFKENAVESNGVVIQNEWASQNYITLKGSAYEIRKQSENLYVLVTKNSHGLIQGWGEKFDYIFLERVTL